MPIFDQGYQHWNGELAGHGWRWLAIARHGVRIGLKGRWVRLLLLGALGPALMLAGGISLWGLVEQKSTWAINFLRIFPSMRELVQDPSAYRVAAWTILFHFFVMIEMYFIMIVVLLVGPTLVSQDLRYNALPLYFSRPLRRIDYFAGKVGVIGFFLALVTVAPAVLAWVLGILFSLDFRAVVDTFRLLLGLIVFGIVVTLSAGLFILALSSLSRNSRYVSASWAGVWILSATVAWIMTGIHRDSEYRKFYVAEHEKDNEMNAKYRRLDDLRMRKFGNEAFGHGPHGGFDVPLGVKPGKRPPGKQVQKNPVAALPAPGDDDPGKPDNPRIVELPQGGPVGKELDAEIDQVSRDLQQLAEESAARRKERDQELRQDWRPIISYFSDLQRLGFALIGSLEAWKKVDDLINFGGKNMQNQGFIIEDRDLPSSHMVPQYPWYWSALVLLGIGVVSVWILNRRVTSLDRLR